MSTTSNNKPKGWFSRRHPSRVEHDKAVETRNALSGPLARRERARQRLEESAAVTPEQQLAYLDEHGLRAVKERAKLQKLVDDPSRSLLKAVFADEADTK